MSFHKGMTMRLKTDSPGWRKTWRRLVVCLVVALTLVPLPAMALTFTSPWQSAITTAGGPKPPTPTFSDATNGGQDDLFVDMGTYQGKNKAALSVISLERQISVPSAGEAINFAHAFATDFKQGGVDVAVAVYDSSGHLVATPITFDQQTNSTVFTTISAVQSASQSFAGGNYILSVGIAYNTNNK